jgi:methyltransferase-like protein/SAM-dependent methyltransferase
MSQPSAEAAATRDWIGTPIPRSQPAWLATVARLRGLQPADVERARVLELGCLKGRNLIALAERYPAATFVGIDASPVEVDAARQAAATVGLTNVEFRASHLTELGKELGAFDYIVAPGVYSSIDDESREWLLSLVRELLTDDGVAYLSYHAYPAWHIHQVLAHLMRYDASRARGPAEQVAAGRGLIQFLRASLTDNNPYHALIQAEINSIPLHDEFALRHAYLGAAIRPVYLREFVSAASRHDLQYLGDGAIGVAYTDRMGDSIEEGLRRVASGPMQEEQYRDVLHNRKFRQTLLCHASKQLVTTLSAEQLQGFYLAAELAPENPEMAPRSTAMERFVAPGGISVATALPLGKTALAHLGEIWPRQVAFEDLVTAACERLSAAGASAIGEPEKARLRQSLVDCCARGVVEVHQGPEMFTAQIAERPTASPWARWQAAHGEAPTNRRHEAMLLESFDAEVLQRLDGTQSREDLVDTLFAAAEQGRLQILQRDQNVYTRESLRQLLSAAVTDSLHRLARHALLI